MRSTKLTNRTKAMSVAIELERASKLATQGLLVEDQARKMLAAIMERVGETDTLRAVSAKDFLSQWISSKEINKRPRTAERYRPVIEGFIASLGERAKRPITGVKADDVQKFLDARRKAGCAPSTVQVDGKILRAAFTRARRTGLIDTNPAEAVELPERNSVERGTFTPAEVASLVEIAQGEWKTLLLVAYYTGQRLMDCARLKWAALDLAAGTIAFTQEKTSTALVVPIYPELREHLESLASSDRPQEYVMPGLAKQPGSGRNGHSSAFMRLMKQAGIDSHSVERAGSRTLNRRTFHALRHSFTSALANAGVNSELRMRLTGHKDAKTHAGYTHHEIEVLRKAVDKLPSLRGMKVSHAK